MSFRDLETALLTNAELDIIIDQLNLVNNDLAIQDAYAFALNTADQDLDDAIIQAFPDLPLDKDFSRDLWIYAQIYDRADLDKVAKEYLDPLPWNELLPIAMIEDIDPMIQLSLLEGTFREEDYILALVAAHRLGNQEMINYLSVLIGPDWEEIIERGYVLADIRDGSIPYRILFQEMEED